MIGKAKSNISLNRTIVYNLKENSRLIFTNKLAGDNLADYRMQMADLQKCFDGRAKMLTLHAKLSPSIEDGNTLTIAQWKSIASKYLKKLELENHQALGFLHSDRDHKHMHIVINKIREDNLKICHDHNIGKKSQIAADQIAREMGLQRAFIVMQERIEQKFKKEQLKAVETLDTTKKTIGAKQEFKTALQVILKNKYNNIDEFFDAIELNGFKVHRYFNKTTGELRGYGIEKNAAKLDASTIGKEFTLKSLQITVTAQKQNVIPALPKQLTTEELKKELSSHLETIASLSFKNTRDYLEILNLTGIYTKLHYNKETGKLRGYSVSKDNVIFFAANELSPKLTLKKLNLEVLDEKNHKEFERDEIIQPATQKDNATQTISLADLKEIKKIRLEDYLLSQGFTETKNLKGSDISVFRRTTKNASIAEIRISKKQNCFWDYNNTPNNSVLQLLMQLHKCDSVTAVNKLIEFIKNNSHSVNLSDKQMKQKEDFEKLGFSILNDAKKIRLLESFAEQMDIKKNALSEAVMLSKEKNFFIALRNDSGGYYLRNKLMIKNIGEPDITTIIINRSKPTFIVDSMMDYLSLRSLLKGEHNFIILNSPANEKLAIQKIQSENLKPILLYLKNDETGKSIIKNLRTAFPDAREIHNINTATKQFNGKLKGNADDFKTKSPRVELPDIHTGIINKEIDFGENDIYNIKGLRS